MNLFELLTGDANLSAEFRRQFMPMSEERKQELRNEQREDEKRDAAREEFERDA